ncbi:MAG: SPOR domain-containing protein [bacterium]|nr:SPOR domain-containing protein [bacterium]
MMVPLALTAKESANPAVEPPAEQREQAPADNERAAGEQLRKPELSQVTKNPDGENTLAEDVGSTQPEPPTPAPRPEAGGDPLTSGSYVVAVLATRDQAHAQQFAGQVESGGYEVFTSSVKIGGRIMYPVWVGPFRRRSQAVTATSRRRRSCDSPIRALSGPDCGILETMRQTNPGPRLQVQSSRALLPRALLPNPVGN